MLLSRRGNGVILVSCGKLYAPKQGRGGVEVASHRSTFRDRLECEKHSFYPTFPFHHRVKAVSRGKSYGPRQKEEVEWIILRMDSCKIVLNIVYV